MYPSHVKYKKCRLEFLQGIMRGNMIDKSEVKLY